MLFCRHVKQCSQRNSNTMDRVFYEFVEQIMGAGITLSKLHSQRYGHVWKTSGPTICGTVSLPGIVSRG
jgi:hypothetical protein